MALFWGIKISVQMYLCEYQKGTKNGVLVLALVMVMVGKRRLIKTES